MSFIKKWKRKRNRGVSLLEAALTLPIIIILTFAVIDISRLIWIKISVRSALSYAVKAAEALPDFLTDVDTLDSTSSRYQAYQHARENIIQEALTYKLNHLHANSKINFREFMHLDLLHSNQRQSYNAPVSVLLPGMGGLLPDLNGNAKLISNSHICPVLFSPGDSGTQMVSPNGGESFAISNGGQFCSGRFKLEDEKISDLALPYPFELGAYPIVDTFIFGKIPVEVKVGGYVKTMASILTTPTPTPTVPPVVTDPPTTEPPIEEPTPTPTPTSTPTREPASCDINHDGTINSDDMHMLEDFLAQPVQDTAHIAGMDLDGDGQATVSDLTHMQTNCMPLSHPEPTPTPTPETPVNECKYYAVKSAKTSQSAWDMEEEFAAQTNAGQGYFSGEGASLSCLQKIVNDAKSACAAARTGFNCVADVQTRADETDRFIGKFFFNEDAAKYQQFVQLEFNCLRFGRLSSGCNQAQFEALTNIYTPKILFIDENCNPVTSADPSLICGDLNVNWMISPISLIWKEGASIYDSTSFTSFALEPMKETRWYTWRASSDTPLLVYDPEKKGKVRSAAQLFGNWFLGGKPSENFKTVSMAEKQELRPWNNGYEALASLDQNDNQKIDGAELTPLSLWFDDNKDGVSQAGEVISADKLGVVSIYTEPDYKDKDTGDIFKKIGFETLINGKLKQGMTVDWYAKAYHSKSQAVEEWQKAAPASEISKKETISNSSESSKTPVASDLDDKIASRKANASTWFWVADGQKAPHVANSGMLTIYDLDDRIFGYSYAETNLNTKEGHDSSIDGQKVKSFIRGLPILGTKELDSDGRTRFTFQMIKDGFATESIAYLSKDGSELNGESSAEIPVGNTKEKVSYAWKAKRKFSY